MADDMRALCTGSTSKSNYGSSRSPAIVDELLSKYSSTRAHSRPTTATLTFYEGEQRQIKRRNVMEHFADCIRLEYYRYEVTFGVYVMTPGEKFVANTLVIVFLSLLIWAMLLYFPYLLFGKLARFVWLITGHNDDVVVFSGIFRQNYIGQGPMPTSLRAP